MYLRRQLAEHGFESNDDYEHALRCLFDQPAGKLRVLHVDGTAGRRKTAFAQALAKALEYPHVLYHDFTAEEVVGPALPVVLDDGSLGPPEPALPAFERALIEACAYSEAERTILILDQLQGAHFGDQMRLYRFATTLEWNSPAGTVLANPKNFLLALVSEQPLYHSLAKCSFRVWTDAQRAFLGYRPSDYGLDQYIEPVFAALVHCCEELNAAPTPSEFGHVIDDLLHRARSEEQIRQSLFGRIESVDRARLYGPELVSPLRELVAELSTYLGAEHVEL